MNIFDVTKLIIDVVSDIQTHSGRRSIGLTGKSRPIGDLPGFDSLNGIEATTELTHRLGREFSDENLLIDETSNRALTIEEIATRIYETTKAMVSP